MYRVRVTLICADESLFRRYFLSLSLSLSLSFSALIVYLVILGRTTKDSSSFSKSYVHFSLIYSQNQVVQKLIGTKSMVRDDRV